MARRPAREPPTTTTPRSTPEPCHTTPAGSGPARRAMAPRRRPLRVEQGGGQGGRHQQEEHHGSDDGPDGEECVHEGGPSVSGTAFGGRAPLLSAPLAPSLPGRCSEPVAER